MRGKLHEALDYPSMPSVFTPLMMAFNDLGDYSFQEIKAYCEMMDTKLDVFDISILKDMDFVRRRVSNGGTVKEILGDFNYGSNNG